MGLQEHLPDAALAARTTGHLGQQLVRFFCRPEIATSKA